MGEVLERAEYRGGVGEPSAQKGEGIFSSLQVGGQLSTRGQAS